MLEELDLPKYIEEKVNNRYESLSEWFSRDNSSLNGIKIDFFSQGSFALGTTIKPIHEDEEYDLDMGCKLNIKSCKSRYSQTDLVQMVKMEIESYRKAHGIQNNIDVKRRCLRLAYKDEVAFHLDIVPCIPLNVDNENEYRIKMFEKYNDLDLAYELAKYAVNITDNQRTNFKDITNDWPISNPQGYLRWFQKRMAQQKTLSFEKRAAIEPIPRYTEKSVLQRCIQLLKRHRDNMYYPLSDKQKESKPISIIITTLAARAYNGESTIEEALLNIINKMPQFISDESPRIPNPVKPEEDFADKWDDVEFQNLNLEMNFKAWLMQAKLDFSKLIDSQQITEVRSLLKDGFNLKINEEKLAAFYPSKIDITRITNISTPSIKPWGK